MNKHTPAPIRIQVIIGSIRDGRAADAVSRWTFAEQCAARRRHRDAGSTRAAVAALRGDLRLGR